MQAYGIFSGGLDSLLSARLLMDQGITPELVTLTSPFFSLEAAQAGARALGLPLRTVDIYSEVLALVKSPPHGLGKHLNPCIDCHALMLRKVGELLEAEGEQGFLFSGEVLGQRPMSQNPRSLKIVAEASGRKELVLRPLSARLLPPTKAEEEGWVDREKLLGLSGRGRRAQMDLAEKYGLPVPPPAGGCLLTDGGFCRRFKWLMERPQAKRDPFWPPARLVEIIKRGRLFSAEPEHWLVVGRHQADNKALTELAIEGDTLFHLESAPGPTVLMPRTDGEAGPASFSLAEHLAAAYGDHGPETEVLVRVERIGQEYRLEKTAVTRPADWEERMVKGV